LIGGKGSWLVDERDDLVELLERDGAVPEYLVPRRRPLQVFLEPHDGFREALNLRHVDPFLRGLLAGLRRLVRGVEGECRVEGPERVVETFQVDEGEALAVPVEFVAGVQARRLVVRLDRG